VTIKKFATGFVNYICANLRKKAHFHTSYHSAKIVQAKLAKKLKNILSLKKQQKMYLKKF
jgi:hypothetical protein